MIQRLSHVTVWVLEPGRAAHEFYMPLVSWASRFARTPKWTTDSVG